MEVIIEDGIKYTWAKIPDFENMTINNVKMRVYSYVDKPPWDEMRTMNELRILGVKPVDVEYGHVAYMHCKVPYKNEWTHAKLYSINESTIEIKHRKNKYTEIVEEDKTKKAKTVSLTWRKYIDYHIEEQLPIMIKKFSSSNQDLYNFFIEEIFPDHIKSLHQIGDEYTIYIIHLEDVKLHYDMLMKAEDDYGNFEIWSHDGITDGVYPEENVRKIIEDKYNAKMQVTVQ